MMPEQKQLNLLGLATRARSIVTGDEFVEKAIKSNNKFILKQIFMGWVMNNGKKIISITFAELKKGMIIAKDVDRNGRVLLKKDTKINEQMIKKLQR